MVFVYAKNSILESWLYTVTLLVWGPSSQLFVNDAFLQEELFQFQGAGVNVAASKACVEKFGIVPQIEALDMYVFYTGEFLTDWIKSGDKLITF